VRCFDCGGKGTLTNGGVQARAKTVNSLDLLLWTQRRSLTQLLDPVNGEGQNIALVEEMEQTGILDQLYLADGDDPCGDGIPVPASSTNPFALRPVEFRHLSNRLGEFAGHGAEGVEGDRFNY